MSERYNIILYFYIRFDNLFLIIFFFSIIGSGIMMNFDFKLEVRFLVREYLYLKFVKDWYFKVIYLKFFRNFKK